jgi:hypothetical protein
MCKEYNGWPNKGTWLVSLRCESQEDVQYAREHLEEIATDLPSLAADLLTWAMALVEWDHLEQVFSPSESNDDNTD